LEDRRRSEHIKADAIVLKVFPDGVVMLSATKNKRRRRFALDCITLAVLLEQRARAEIRSDALGVDLADDASQMLKLGNAAEFPASSDHGLGVGAKTEFVHGVAAPIAATGADLRVVPSVSRPLPWHARHTNGRLSGNRPLGERRQCRAEQRAEPE
jgi:hypothetical protein